MDGLGACVKINDAFIPHSKNHLRRLEAQKPKITGLYGRLVMSYHPA